MDDVYLGGGRNGGKAGSESENNIAFVGVVSVDSEGRTLIAKLTHVPGFTCKAIKNWSKSHLSNDCSLLYDGLA